MKTIARLLFTAIAVVTISYILPNVRVDDMLTALVVAVVLAFLNTYLKPLLVLFTIPITIFTLGLFLLVINALIIIVVDYLIDGFYVGSFWSALLFSFLLSVSVSFYNNLEKKGGQN